MSSIIFLCLPPFALTPANRAALLRLTRRQWLLLFWLGLVSYTLVQGALSVIGSLIFFYPAALPRQQVFGLLVALGGMLALAFTLWNHSLRHLSAMESALINNTMMAQIAILA